MGENLFPFRRRPISSLAAMPGLRDYICNTTAIPLFTHTVPCCRTNNTRHDHIHVLHLYVWPRLTTDSRPGAYRIRWVGGWGGRRFVAADRSATVLPSANHRFRRPYIPHSGRHAVRTCGVMNGGTRLTPSSFRKGGGGKRGRNDGERDARRITFRPLEIHTYVRRLDACERGHRTD